MAEFYDRTSSNSSGSFMMGLITGTAIGAGLGLLFAPKSGAELRNQLTTRAGDLADTASDVYQTAAERASNLADRGREMFDRTRDVVARTADEAERYARDVTNTAANAASDVTRRG
jgi:gas vesicle protein